MSARARVDVARLFAHIGRDKRLATHRHMSDQALTHFEVELLHVGNVVAAHGFGVKDTGLIRTSFPFREGTRALHEIYASRVVWNNRIKSIHDEVQNLLQIEGPANLIGDVEQHAQLVHKRQTGSMSFYCRSHKECLSSVRRGLKLD